MNKNWILIFFSAWLSSQTVQINDISISSKKNGVSIQIRSDTPIKPTQITGWYNSSTSSYYITIYEADGDSDQLESVKYGYPIINIEVMSIGESLQLGFRLAYPVEQFEFYYSDQPPEVLAALRFPLSDIMDSMKSEQLTRAPNLPNIPKEQAIWPKAFYFMGAGLAGAGFLAGESQKGWEITVGMGLVAVAYIYENIIHETEE